MSDRGLEVVPRFAHSDRPLPVRGCSSCRNSFCWSRIIVAVVPSRGRSPASAGIRAGSSSSSSSRCSECRASLTPARTAVAHTRSGCRPGVARRQARDRRRSGKESTSVVAVLSPEPAVEPHASVLSPTNEADQRIAAPHRPAARSPRQTVGRTRSIRSPVWILWARCRLTVQRPPTSGAPGQHVGRGSLGRRLRNSPRAVGTRFGLLREVEPGVVDPVVIHAHQTAQERFLDLVQVGRRSDRRRIELVARRRSRWSPCGSSRLQTVGGRIVDGPAPPPRRASASMKIAASRVWGFGTGIAEVLLP